MAARTELEMSQDILRDREGVKERVASHLERLEAAAGRRMLKGTGVLATIGATAPFVGLFGTVWGVYHALVAIGISGSGALDQVAGPVGEALIMTGIGLAVALPAVMGYNWLTRSNRVLTAKLDAFAFELLTFLSTGRTLGAAGTPSRSRTAAQVGR